MPTTQSAGRIVVGVDGSPESHAALSWAIDEAARRGVGLMIVHVMEGSNRAGTPYAGDDPDQVTAAARRVLQEAVDRARARAVPAVGALRHGSPGRALVAASEDASLLVVGCHGRGPLGRAVFGSVSSVCVPHAACPVVVMTPRACANQLEQAPSLGVSIP